jgi:transcription initiation factor TFIIIB Brf1 subunit/transcription initiation factor TFIIB
MMNKTIDFYLAYYFEENPNMALQNKTIEIVEKAKEKRIHWGHCPKTFVCGCLYVASLLVDPPLYRLTQRELRQYFGIAEVTIRSSYKAIDKALEFGLQGDLKKNAHYNFQEKVRA